VDRAYPLHGAIVWRRRSRLRSSRSARRVFGAAVMPPARAGWLAIGSPVQSAPPPSNAGVDRTEPDRDRGPPSAAVMVADDIAGDWLIQRARWSITNTGCASLTRQCCGLGATAGGVSEAGWQSAPRRRVAGLQRFLTHAFFSIWSG